MLQADIGVVHLCFVKFDVLCSFLDLLCFTKLLTVWQKCPSKASLLRHIRVPEENTI